MSPVEQKWDKLWYFVFSMVEFGPYGTEEEAWEKYEEVTNSAKSCKNCED